MPSVPVAWRVPTGVSRLAALHTANAIAAPERRDRLAALALRLPHHWGDEPPARRTQLLPVKELAARLQRAEQHSAVDVAAAQPFGAHFRAEEPAMERHALAGAAGHERAKEGA